MRPMALPDRVRRPHSLNMRSTGESDGYRCSLCQRTVDADTRDRARHAWQPLIVCERCFFAADTAPDREKLGFSASIAAR